MSVSRPAIDRLFAPESVAVVGASATPGKPGHNVVRHMIDGGFGGDIWPVNPRGGAICALDCHTSIDELPGAPDIAFLAVPAGRTEEALRDCAKRGAGVAIIGAGGFAELGTEDGRLRQQQLCDVAAGAGIRLLGPNTNGLVSAVDRLALGFNVCFPEAVRSPGPVSIVSHSGALFDSLSRRLARAGTGLARFVAVGNEADISLVEIMEWLAADPATRVIGLVLEALDDAGRFRRAAALAARGGKRIVALKIGRSQAGAGAALAHSSRTAGSARAYSALFREAGVASVRSIEALAGACAILALTSEWNVAAEPLLCVSTSGAGGALLADAACERGLELAGTADGGWPEAAAAALAGLSSSGDVRHPIDLGTLGDWAPLRRVLEALTPLYPGPVVAFSHMPPTAEMGENLFDALAARRASGGRPVVLLSPGGLAAEAEVRFAKAAIPVFHDTSCLMESLAALLAGGPPPTDPPAAPEPDAQRRIKVAAAIDAAQERGLKVMSEAESSAVFTWMGLPMAKSLLAADPAAAVVAAESIGFPVALKGHVPGVAHKAVDGLVRLNLCDPDAVRAAATCMRETALLSEDAGFLVQQMHEPAVEVILAVTRDPQLGPFALYGLGGVEAETAGKTEMLPIPVDTGRLRGRLEMSELGRRMTQRLGQHAPAALDRLAAALQALALLALEQGDALMAAEVNPMIVTADGSCVGVDSLIEIASEGETP